MKKVNSSPMRLRLISALLVLLAGSAATSGKVIYVDAAAPGADDGTNWENAYNFLQDALADAHSISSTATKEIRVAQGVYTPDSNSAVPQGTGDREASFELIGSRKMTLQGGYAGCRGPDPNARDVDLYKTILSGDLAGNDDPDFANYGDNSYHVVVAVYTYDTLVFDGFTITAGNATGVGGFTIPFGSYKLEVNHDSGGGIYGTYYCLGTFENCTFRKNKAIWGAGMYYSGDWGKATLKSCVFGDNTAFGGGGMFIGGHRNFLLDLDCAPTLNDCTFEGNSAELGGAMYSQSYLSKPALNDCYLAGNTATFYGGAIYNERGILTVKVCNFVENSTLLGGGLLGGGAIYSLNAAPLTIANCIFSGNASAAVGGALYVGSCRPGAMNSEDEGTCGGSGGQTIGTSTFVGNKAANCGGAICWGIGRAKMANCILWGNIAPQGKEMAIDPHFIGDHEDRVEDDISYCDVEGGVAGVFYMEPDCRKRPPCGNDPNCFACNLDWGTNNLNADPCFADPGHWNENGTPDDTSDDFWVNGDYHLKSETGRWDPSLWMWVQDYVTSPCIDSGSSLNYDEPPPQSGYINLGAYGGTAEASKACFPRSSCGVRVEGDLNGDCLINGMDLAIMAQNWRFLGSSSAWCAAFLAGNMDYNREIDFGDLLVIAQHWLEEN